MRNPIRDEATAFHLVLLAAVGAVAVGLVGALVDRWAALGLALAVAVAALVAGRGAAREAAPPAAAPPATGRPRRIVVLANETLAGAELRDELAQRLVAGPLEVHVVVPALESRLRYWSSDTDAAVEAARERLRATLARLADAGVEATGAIGDDDPVQALEDALWRFAADEVLVATHVPERSHWLARNVVARVRERVAVPVTHVVVSRVPDRVRAGSGAPR